MYILIKITTNGIEVNEKVSKKKKNLETYIKQKGFYFSKYFGLYIDDKNTDNKISSGCDYKIEKIEEI